MLDKHASTSVPIHELPARRWSGRAFDRARPVNRPDLTALLEAARWAPSCFGDEPWRYLVWDRFREETGWRLAFECLSPGNQAWAGNAPLLLLSTADSEFVNNGKPNRWGQHDTGAASENLCLRASALGLMAHQMGGFNADKIRQTFAIPDRYACMAMIAVGHPGGIEVCRRRGAGYPAPPAQIPACGITAPGSSWILTSAVSENTFIPTPSSARVDKAQCAVPAGPIA